MRLDRRLTLNLITVLLLGVLMVGWVITRIVGGGPGGGSFSVTADFAGSGGVFTNQEVTYRGVLVGRVGEMDLNADGVDVELLIDSEWENEISADLVASVQSKSAVGEQFVNLTPTGTAGDNLTNGDRIEREDTELPVEFQSLLRSLDRVVSEISPERTASVVRELAAGIGGREREIATILTSLGTLSEGFASAADEQRRLLDNAPRAGAEFLRTKEEFTAAIRAADQVFATIGDDPERLRSLFAANDRFARDAIALLARRGDELAGGIGALADFTEFQFRERDSIIGALEYVPQFLHAIEDAAVPWRSADGREFYRIRTGLIYDDVPSSWPCGYVHPDGYTRYPFERAPKRVITTGRCVPSEAAAQTTQAIAGALVEAIDRWVVNEGASPSPQGEAGAGGIEVPPRPRLWAPTYMRPFEVASAP